MTHKLVRSSIALACLAALPSAYAAAVWNNTGTDWNTAGNWTGGLPTAGLGNSGAGAFFDVAASTSPNVSASYTAGGLYFTTAAASGYTVSSSDSSTTLTLTSYGSSGVSANWAINAQNTSGTNTVSAPVVLDPYYGGTTRNIAVLGQASGGTLIISGQITETGTATDLWLVGNGSGGSFDITGTNNSYTGGTGNGALGGTVIARGATVRVASLGNAGSNGSLGKGQIIIGNSGVLSGQGAGPATLVYAGPGESSNKTIIVGIASTTIDTTGASGALTLSSVSMGTAAAKTLTLKGSSAGNIISSNLSDTGVGNKLIKDGTGEWTLSGTNSYSGTTTVSNGKLLINGTHTGAGTYSVSGTLGGSGSITTTGANGVTVNAGGKLAPGAATPSALTLNLGTSGSLNIAAAVNADNSQSMLFDLDTPTTSDSVVLLSGRVLNIGSGVLNFDDFAFSPTANLANGVYTLFDTSATITGTLGANLTGTVSGRAASISLANSDQDVIVTIVPEPVGVGLLSCVGALLIRRRARRTA